MFSYYGSKSRVVKLYPRPKHDKLIECFAGSARYALEWFDRDVLLVDKYEVIVQIWQWLQQCSPKDILSLPVLKAGENLLDYNLAEPERAFLGMCAGIAPERPRNKISNWAGVHNDRKNRYKNIASQLFKIKHWNIKLGTYEDIINEAATWFIDSPYQFGGWRYVENKIDYNHLSKWCVERIGQTIVCENTKADWLPFVPMVKMRGANMKHTVEAIWTNEANHYQFEQQKLF